MTRNHFSGGAGTWYRIGTDLKERSYQETVSRSGVEGSSRRARSSPAGPTSAPLTRLVEALTGPEARDQNRATLPKSSGHHLNQPKQLGFRSTGRIIREPAKNSPRDATHRSWPKENRRRSRWVQPCHRCPARSLFHSRRNCFHDQVVLVKIGFGFCIGLSPTPFWRGWRDLKRQRGKAGENDPPPPLLREWTNRLPRAD